MKLNKYPDGTSYMVGSPEHHGVHTFKVNSYEDLWHLNQFVDNYVHTTNGLIPTILIPNLIDAQADKRFAHNQSTGLKLVCKFLNGMKARFKIFHPHNPEVVEALIDNLEILDNKKFIMDVLDDIQGVNFHGADEQLLKEEDKIESNLILMSSDAGGFKPLMKLCDKLDWQGETISASKYRSVATVDGKITSKLQQFVGESDFIGKDILIVDDICVYGGTFKGLAKILRERNCGKLYLAVSHMTIQNLGKDPVTNYFDKVFTTNSKFNNYWHIWGDDMGVIDKYQPKNLQVIKLF